MDVDVVPSPKFQLYVTVPAGIDDALVNIKLLPEKHCVESLIVN